MRLGLNVQKCNNNVGLVLSSLRSLYKLHSYKLKSQHICRLLLFHFSQTAPSVLGSQNLLLPLLLAERLFSIADLIQ